MSEKVSSQSRMILMALGRSASPSLVNSTRRVLRVNSRPPNWPSSFWIDDDNAG